MAQIKLSTTFLTIKNLQYMEMQLEQIKINGIDSKRPIVIAGPCSAESREQVLATATALAAKGVKIFRAGIWKPRTKPGGFEGVGAVGLPWLKEVKQVTGMLTATEVATPYHVFEAIKAQPVLTSRIGPCL